MKQVAGHEFFIELGDCLEGRKVYKKGNSSLKICWNIKCMIWVFVNFIIIDSVYVDLGIQFDHKQNKEKL